MVFNLGVIRCESLVLLGVARGIQYLLKKRFVADSDVVNVFSGNDAAREELAALETTACERDVLFLLFT